MKIEQIYTGCISHAAYYIESKGEAAIYETNTPKTEYVCPTTLL